MKPTIEDLWNGNLAPGPNCGAADVKIERAFILMDRYRQSLEETLSNGQKTALEKYLAHSDAYIRLISSQAFSDGFCLASKLLTEALD